MVSFITEIRWEDPIKKTKLYEPNWKFCKNIRIHIIIKPNKFNFGPLNIDLIGFIPPKIISLYLISIMFKIPLFKFVI